MEGIRHSKDDLETSFNGALQVLRRLNQRHLEQLRDDPGLHYAYPVELYEQILEAVLDTKDASLVDALVKKAMGECADLRFYGYRIFERILRKNGSVSRILRKNGSVSRILGILSHVPPTGNRSLGKKRQRKKEEEKLSLTTFVEIPKGYLEQICSPKAQAHEFSQAWLALIGAIKDEDSKGSLMGRLLRILHRKVLPFMTRPVLLADFLTAAYNEEGGGLTAILALEGLFYLIQRHNLDYPSFFPKLYRLFCRLDRLAEERDHLSRCTEHRARLLRLVGLFMQSTMLPAHVVASFVKRSLRMALTASPALSLWSLAFSYNQMKGHPAIRPMIHREAAISAAFEASSHDPAMTGAIDGSLWEIPTLARHYWGPTVRLAGLFSERLTKEPFDLDQILLRGCHGGLSEYGPMLAGELEHHWSKVPPVKHDIPECPF